MVVSELLVVTRVDNPGVEVDARDVGLAEANIGGAPEDRPERIDDVGWVEEGGGHLVQEGRKQVIVVPVHEQHIDRAAIELPRTGEPAEATAYDDDLRSRRNAHSQSQRDGRSHPSLVTVRTPA